MMIQVCQRCEYALIKRLLSQTLHQLGLPRNVEPVGLNRAYQAQQLHSLLLYLPRPLRQLLLIRQHQCMPQKHMKHLWPHENLSQSNIFGNQLEALDHRLSHVNWHIGRVINHNKLHQMSLLYHGYYLAAPRQSLDRLCPQCDFSVVEELPLLEPHEDLRVYTLEVLILAGMLKAQLFCLIEDILSQVVFLSILTAVGVLGTVFAVSALRLVWVILS